MSSTVNGLSSGTTRSRLTFHGEQAISHCAIRPPIGGWSWARKAENYVLGKAQENIKLLIKLRHKNQIWCSKLLSYVFKFERINQNDRQSDYFRPFSQVYFIISACLQSKKYRNPHAFSAV